MVPPAMGAHSDLIIASNRGPLSFTSDQEGRLTPTKAAGGLVSSLAPAVKGTGALWVAAAITDADRTAAQQGLVEAEGLRVRPLAFEPDVYRQFYDVVSNATLWSVHHDLFDLARRPRLDSRWRQAWDSFRQVNRRFAEVVAEEAPGDGAVVVHDYHLALVGTVLSELRPDLRTVHFNHTPFCEPTGLRVLPDDVADDLLEGMAGYDACGFHSARWARAFERCYEGRTATPPRTFVAPAVVDLEDLEEVARSDECAAELARLDEEVGDRRLIGRVERIEPSKNLLRGFLAFEELLREQPEWRGRVVFAAHVYPSRSTLPDDLAYRMEVEALVERINNRWATPDWIPVVLDTSDSFPRSVAILRRCEVLLVNPIRDGFNLVAKEGAAVSECDAVLVLSREAGAWDELGPDAVGINPFDVAATGQALHQALRMEPEERAARSGRLRATARGKTPPDWLAELLAPLGAPAQTSL